MFDSIYEWLKNLTTYTVLVAVVMQLLPSEEYRKYIHFFCGMVLIVLLVSPLFQLVGIREDFEELYHSRAYEQVVRELEEAEEVALEVEQEVTIEEELEE